MTGQSERIRESHRGWRMAEPASQSRLRSLQATGHAFELLDDFTAIVVTEYMLNLAASHWYLIDDPTVHGYLVSTLDTEIRKRAAERLGVPPGTTTIMIDTFSSKNPAPDRDSDATGDRTAETITASAVVIAESGAGASSLLLPVVVP